MNKHQERVKKFKKLMNEDLPINCSACGGKMIFQGIGSYICEKCASIEYDNYGKVRNYIEKHPGANAVTTAKALGLDRHVVWKMLNEHQFGTFNSKNTLN